jgi:hypothetical protein
VLSAMDSMEFHINSLGVTPLPGVGKGWGRGSLMQMTPPTCLATGPAIGQGVLHVYSPAPVIQQGPQDISDAMSLHCRLLRIS